MEPGEPYYLELAEEFLTSVLSSPYFEPDADDSWQALLRGVTSEHGSPETGSVFADYYLLETMVSFASPFLKLFVFSILNNSADGLYSLL